MHWGVGHTENLRALSPNSILLHIISRLSKSEIPVAISYRARYHLVSLWRAHRNHPDIFTILNWAIDAGSMTQEALMAA